MAVDPRDALNAEPHPIPSGWTWRWQDEVFQFFGGAQPPASTFVDTPRPGYVRLIQIRDYYTDSYITYVPDSSKLRKCSTEDVMIARYGSSSDSSAENSLGRICRGLEGAYNVALARTEPAEDVERTFLFYLLKSAYFQGPLRAQGSRSVQAGFNKNSLRVIRLPIPPQSEQRTIAHILGTLDDKIELNRRMSDTLEAMTRALFNSWFVDYDPVRAKAEGRDPGLPKHIADLFPSRLVDSELGEIPEGWTMGMLGDIAEHPRLSVRPEQIEPETPYIALEHMPKRCIALSDWGTGDGLVSSKFRFNRGEILFGKLRPYFHKVGVAPVDGVCSTDIVVVTPRAAEWFGFVLGHTSSTEFVDFTNAGSTGTKMPRTSWKDMARYEIVLPPAPVTVAFNRMVQPTLERIIESTHESRALASLRDALLPKLIAGEIRLKDIDRLAAHQA